MAPTDVGPSADSAIETVLNGDTGSQTLSSLSAASAVSLVRWLVLSNGVQRQSGLRLLLRPVVIQNEPRFQTIYNLRFVCDSRLWWVLQDHIWICLNSCFKYQTCLILRTGSRDWIWVALTGLRLPQIWILHLKMCLVFLLYFAVLSVLLGYSKPF